MDGNSLSHSRGLQAAGLLLAGSGVALLFATLFATDVALGLSIVALAAILLTAGVGLLLRRVWGWHLGLLVTVSGAGVVTVRLLGSGVAEWASLLATLAVDLLLLIVLLVERPRRRAHPSHTGA